MLENDDELSKHDDSQGEKQKKKTIKNHKNNCKGRKPLLDRTQDFPQNLTEIIT